MPPILILIWWVHWHHHHASPCYRGRVCPVYSSNEYNQSTISKNIKTISYLDKFIISKFVTVVKNFFALFQTFLYANFFTGSVCILVQSDCQSQRPLFSQLQIPITKIRLIMFKFRLLKSQLNAVAILNTTEVANHVDFASQTSDAFELSTHS